MHELKRDYTIVIVTHNMQQAARVADMTAFFSLDVHDDGSRNGHPRRVRRDAEDLHAAGRLAHRGLRHGPVRLMRIPSRRSSTALETALQEEGELVLRALRGAMNALGSSDTELADEVIAFDDQIDALYFDIQGGIQVAARAADAGRGRPAARAGAPALEPPPRAHGRLLRDDREARQARVRTSSRSRRSSTRSRTWARARRR